MILRELFAYLDDNIKLANDNLEAQKILLEFIKIKTQDLTNYTMLKDVPELILDN